MPMQKINASDILSNLIALAQSNGASAADAVFVESHSVEVAKRLGKTEKLERSESADIGLRVMAGKKAAMISISYQPGADLAEFAERAVAMAKAAPDDPYCGLAEPSELAKNFPKMDSFDPTVPVTSYLEEQAVKAEEAARAVKGVTNSEGGSASFGQSFVTLVASNAFSGTYNLSSHGVSASVIAGEGAHMERDYDYTHAVYLSDLEKAEIIGRKAGERAVKRLNPRKVKTQEAPVVFDPRVARGLLGYFSSAINGAAIARGTSFLKEKMGAQIFSPGISIIDNPHLLRGVRSKPFDAEGLPTVKRSFVENGVLQSWILDLRSARQLKLHSTGNAARGVSSPPGPSPTNMHIAAGALSPKELMADIKSGFYVTETMGMGVNLITGDFSQGAAGFWIENGEIAYPVSEITIAGALPQMFAQLSAANDLELKHGLDSPTLRVEKMTIAGA